VYSNVGVVLLCTPAVWADTEEAWCVAHLSAKKGYRIGTLTTPTPWVHLTNSPEPPLLRLLRYDGSPPAQHTTIPPALVQELPVETVERWQTSGNFELHNTYKQEKIWELDSHDFI
jgi:hypothetical protein